MQPGVGSNVHKRPVRSAPTPDLSITSTRGATVESFISAPAGPILPNGAVLLKTDIVMDHVGMSIVTGNNNNSSPSNAGPAVASVAADSPESQLQLPVQPALAVVQTALATAVTGPDATAAGADLDKDVLGSRLESGDYKDTDDEPDSPPQLHQLLSALQHGNGKQHQQGGHEHHAHQHHHHHSDEVAGTPAVQGKQRMQTLLNTCTACPYCHRTSVILTIVTLLSLSSTYCTAESG